MKKIFTFASIALIALVALSCRKATQETPVKYQPVPKLEFDGPGSLEFNPEGGQICLEIKTTHLVDVKASSDWVGAEVSGRFVYVSAPVNNSIYTRYSTVTIKAGDRSCSLQAKQRGTPSNYYWEPEYLFEHTGGSITLKFQKTDATVRLDVEGQDWITVSMKDDQITIDVAMNPDDQGRQGTVNFKAGSDVRKVVIKQKAESGDTPVDDEPEAVTYASWIGNWTSSVGTLTIAEGDEAKGLYIMSFEQFGEQKVPAFFNEETGELEFYSYKLDVDGNWEYYLGAKDTDDYIELGGPDEDIMLASAKLTDSGKGFTITGNEFQAVYSGKTYDIVIARLVVVAYLLQKEGDYDEGWYTLNGISDVVLPAAYSKAGTSSVSSVKSNSTSLNHRVSAGKKLHAR